MGKASRDKGARREIAIVARHRNIGVKAERVPLSGASRYRGNGADVDIYPFGPDAAPLLCEVKARENGEGFKTIEAWLGDHDVLFLQRDQEAVGQPAPEPLVVIPWRVWDRFLRMTKRKLL
jgi:hypothetical protein